MKALILLGLFGFFISFSAQAADGDQAAGLIVGQVWTSGEIGKDVDGAVAPGIFYEYGASDIFSLYVSAVTSKHNDDKLKLTSTNLGMKANLFFLDKLSPYALVGAGLYFVKRQVGPPNLEIAKKTVFGLNLGLGAELDLSQRFFVALEFDIHNLFSGNVTLPAHGRTEISGRWTGFFLKGGVRF
ncbi:MAG: outer membrane beta-barrel protein [Bacteriovoracia bacterium]